MRPSPPLRVVRAPARLLTLTMLAAGAVACSPGETGAARDDAPTPTVPMQATPAPAAMATDDLASKAQLAVAENRIFAPEGDNAIEFYLAEREQVALGDASAEAALVELQPYAMMAAEQAIAGEDFAEAERLIALMVRIDPTAPSLTRLRGDLETGREAQAIAAAAAGAEAEAVTTAATTAAAPSPAPSATTASPAPTRPEPVAATPRPAPPESGAPREARPAARAPAPPAPAAPVPGPLVPVSTPFPPFPSEAIARGRSRGSVTASFTVRANGRVTDVRIVEARPEGLFERTVIETLGAWRFEPPGTDQTQTRTFDFSN